VLRKRGRGNIQASRSLRSVGKSSLTLKVNAEIHLGTRSVLEYLLSPVQKVAHEAGREW